MIFKPKPLPRYIVFLKQHYNLQQISLRKCENTSVSPWHAIRLSGWAGLGCAALAGLNCAGLGCAKETAPRKRPGLAGLVGLDWAGWAALGWLGSARETATTELQQRNCNREAAPKKLHQERCNKENARRKMQHENYKRWFHAILLGISLGEIRTPMTASNLGNIESKTTHQCFRILNSFKNVAVKKCPQPSIEFAGKHAPRMAGHSLFYNLLCRLIFHRCITTHDMN